MPVAEKYRLVAEGLRNRAAMPEVSERRAHLLSLAEQFEEIAGAAEKEDWSDIDAPPSLAA